MDYTALLKKRDQADLERKAVVEEIKKALAELQPTVISFDEATKKELDICHAQLAEWQKKAEFYENGLKVCQKAGKRSGGCWFKKIISLWMWRCQ